MARQAFHSQQPPDNRGAERRKRKQEQVSTENASAIFGDGVELLAAAAERMGLEGEVSMRRNAAYRSGPRCG